MKPPLPNYIAHTNETVGGGSYIFIILIAIILIAISYFLYKEYAETNRYNDK